MDCRHSWIKPFYALQPKLHRAAARQALFLPNRVVQRCRKCGAEQAVRS